MNEPNKIEPLEGPKKIESVTRCTKYVLSKDVCHANQLLPWIARRRGESYKWGGGASTHI